MRFPGFSQVCPAGSTRDPSRGQKIGCHIENLHATNFFLGRMMGKILWAVHLVPITLMSCDGLLVCVCFWVYIYKVMFLGEWSFKGHVLVVTSAPNAHPAKINKHLQDIHIYIYFVPSTSLGTMSRSKKKSCDNALGLSYPHWSTQLNRAIMIYGLSCVPGAGFSQHHVYLYFYMQNDKQNPKCFISQPILSISGILATNQETSQHKRVMNQGYRATWKRHNLCFVREESGFWF